MNCANITMPTDSNKMKLRSNSSQSKPDAGNSEEFLLASSITEDIIEAFRNDDVLAAMAKALTPFISRAVKEAMDNSLQDINTRLHMIEDNNKILNEKTQELTVENLGLKNRLRAAEDALRTVELNERAHNIIISGLRESSYAERSTDSSATNSPQAESHAAVERTVLDVINNKLNVEAKPENIAVAYRLKKGQKDSTRPIFVKFTSRKVRDAVYSARKKLDGQNIYISEHLTKENSDLLFKARQLKRDGQIFSTWSRGGLVYIKMTDDVNAKPKLISSPLDLPNATRPHIH